jgi:hypothetical protein
VCALLVTGVFLLTAPGEAYAEAGEPFGLNEPPPRAAPMPAMVMDDGPAVGAVPAPRDPPRMEAARGARMHDALAKPPIRRATATASTWKKLPAPPPPPPIQPVAAPEKPSLLVLPAAAAESADADTPPVSWRRLLASSYAVWIAAIALIGVPLLNLLRRFVAAWREERDLAEN